jgi:DNA-binding SARP family transcriptional activator
MFSAFTTMTTNQRLIIVAPTYRQKPQLLAQFLNLAASGYVRFEGANLNTDDMLTQIVSVYIDWDVLQDLSYLILDECDRSIPVEFDSLLHKLLLELPNTYIVVLSRRLPNIIYDSAARKLIHTIPKNSVGSLPPIDNAYVSLEVEAFGSGRVAVNGRDISDWKGYQFKEIFFFMIENPQVSRHVISNTFWSHLDIKAAMNVFHVVKRQLHKLLGFRLIEHVNGVYRLSHQINLNYDVARFSQLIEDGIAAQDESMLTQAYQMCRYDFLQESEAMWVRNRRQEIYTQYAEAILQLANIKAANGYADVALKLYRQLRLLLPHREDIAKRLMSFYMERGEPEFALQIYHEIADYLVREVALEPTSDLKKLGEAAQLQILKNYIRQKRSS